MPLIDYTSLANVKAYADLQANTDDTLITGLITSMSRQLDTYCNQVFAGQTYTNQVRRALVASDGLLCCWPDCPTISSITAASWRQRTSRTWTALDVTSSNATDIEQSQSGCAVRFLTANLQPWRGLTIQVQLSYTGGWAALADVPADFESLTRRLVWWAYKKRSAPLEKTADLETGQVFIPSSWPKDIREGFNPWRKYTL